VVCAEKEKKTKKQKKDKNGGVVLGSVAPLGVVGGTLKKGKRKANLRPIGKSLLQRNISG